MAATVCIVLRTPQPRYVHARMHDARYTMHARTHACTLANRMLRSPPPAQSTRFPATCPRLSRRAYPSRAKLRRIQAPLRRKGISKTPTLNFFRPETLEEISFPKFSRTEEAPIQVRLPPGVVIILRK